MDAETGIKLAREHRPNLILMDIQLPGLDGLSATRILREDVQTRDIPIVAVTSFAMEGDRQKALDAGCTGYISKPLNTRTFRHRSGHIFTSGYIILSVSQKASPPTAERLNPLYFRTVQRAF